MSALTLSDAEELLVVGHQSSTSPLQLLLTFLSNPAVHLTLEERRDLTVDLLDMGDRLDEQNNQGSDPDLYRQIHQVLDLAVKAGGPEKELSETLWIVQQVRYNWVRGGAGVQQVMYSNR